MTDTKRFLALLAALVLTAATTAAAVNLAAWLELAP
jgi:hypothetical protein